MAQIHLYIPKKAHPSTTGQDDGIGPGQTPRPGSSLNVAFSLVRRVSAKVSNVGSRKPGRI